MDRAKALRYWTERGEIEPTAAGEAYVREQHQLWDGPMQAAFDDEAAERRGQKWALIFVASIFVAWGALALVHALWPALG